MERSVKRQRQRLGAWAPLAAFALAAIVPLAAADPVEIGLTVVDNGTPSLAAAGQQLDVRLVLRNDGSNPWETSDPMNVAAHWYDATGSLLQWDGIRTPLPERVPPGEQVAMSARLETPAEPGTYRVVWDVVHEGSYWVSRHDPTPPRPTVIRVGPSHAFTLAEGTTPKRLRSGREVMIPLRLTNDGVTPWPASGDINVAYHWLAEDGTVVVRDGERTPVPRATWPGDTVHVEARLRAPEAPGRYRLQWDMVHEGVCWFEQQDPTPTDAVPVIVLPRQLSGLPLLTSALVGVAALFTGLWLSRWRRRSARWIAVGDILWLAAVLAVVPWGLIVQSNQQVRAGPVAVATAGVALLLLAILAIPSRLRPGVALLCGALSLTLIWADSLHQRYFGDLLSPAALHAAGQLGDVSASIAALAQREDLWLAVVLVPGVVLCWLAAAARDHHPSKKPVALCLLLVAVVGSLGLTAVDLTIVGQTFETTLLASEIGPLSAHALDLTRYIATVLLPGPREGRVQEIYSWFDATRSSRTAAGTSPAAASGHNLLMVQVESLQSFVIGLEIQGQEITPNLNRWIRQAIWFTTMRDQTADGRSSDAELASQCSLLPMPHGSAAFLHPDNDYTGLAEILADAGWSTISAVPFRRGFWNRGLTHPAFGYQRSLFDEDFSGGEIVGWGLNDRAFFRHMASRLERIDEPFCAWLLTLSLHHPFDLFPSHLRRLDLSSLPSEELANYLHTMHLFDQAWGELVTWLATRELGERTVVAVWGDHDAGFGFEAEIAATAGIPMRAPDWYTSDSVPFAVAIPGVEGDARALPAGHTDITPTLLAAVGVDSSRFAFMGRNLLLPELDPTRPVVGMNGSWMSSERLWIPTEREGKRCWDRSSDRPLPDSGCAEGTQRAQQIWRLSTDILRHDLQQRLHSKLSTASSTP